MFATRWQPLHLATSDWHRLRGEVERAFECLAGTAASAAQRCACPEHPALNMWEEDTKFVVEAELPGLDLEQLEILVNSDNHLTLKGERSAPEQQEGKWHRQERAFGNFTRSVQLPQDVDAEQVAAEFKNGILTISLPKKAEVQPRRIQVTSS